jgi:hypothetical protein
MSADKTADAVKFLLRLPKGLHRRLLQDAKRRNVSLNTQIVDELQGYEKAAVERITEIVKPLLDEAVSTSSTVATDRVYEILQSHKPEK